MIIYVSLIAAVLLGIIGLALDASRAMISKSEAQAAADAAALAAAAQLDGSSDSITRAIAAAQTLIENDQRFAEGSDGAKVAIAQLRFLDGLPVDDDSPITNGFVVFDWTPGDSPEDGASAADAARFVEVRTEGLKHTNLFLVVLGVARNATVGATAVAGFKSVMCRIPPVFICNPGEEDAVSNPRWDPTGWEGRMVRAKTGAAGDQWGPGNFGLLQVFGSNSTNEISDNIAKVNADNRCFGASGVDMAPGNRDTVRYALNVRFDRYEGQYNQSRYRTSENFRPAANVTIDGRETCPSETGGQPPGKGKGGGGGGGALPTASWFPRDENLSDSEPFGNGIWVTSCASWWATNHNINEDPTPPGCTSDPATTTVTRYDLYRYEIETERLPNRGEPICNRRGLSDIPDRRIMYMAVVNCRYHSINGAVNDIPTVGFIKGFLTEPAVAEGGNEKSVIFLEVIEATESGPDDDVMRDDVQLYR